MSDTRPPIRGTVRRGASRGRSLGFPTANLDDVSGALPPEGVYAARAEVDGETYAAAATVGLPPSFDDAVARVEVHLIDYEGDLYERTLAVTFVEKVRDQARFDSMDALKRQMADDVRKIRDILGA